MNIRKNLSKILMIAMLGVMPITFAFGVCDPPTNGHDYLSLLHRNLDPIDLQD